MRDILVFISSIKPSRGPFITDEVGGSPIALDAGLRNEKTKAFFSLDIKRNIASGDISRGLLYGDDFDFVCVGNRVLQRFEKRFFYTVAIFERSHDVLFKENFVDIAVDIGKKTAFVAHVQTTTLEVVAV